MSLTLIRATRADGALVSFCAPFLRRAPWHVHDLRSSWRGSARARTRPARSTRSTSGGRAGSWCPPMVSASERKPAPLAAICASVFSRSRVDRASRSRRVTVNTLPSASCSSARRNCARGLRAARRLPKTPFRSLRRATASPARLRSARPLIRARRRRSHVTPIRCGASDLPRSRRGAVCRA